MFSYLFTSCIVFPSQWSSFSESELISDHHSDSLVLLLSDIFLWPSPKLSRPLKASLLRDMRASGLIGRFSDVLPAMLKMFASFVVSRPLVAGLYSYFYTAATSDLLSSNLFTRGLLLELDFLPSSSSELEPDSDASRMSGNRFAFIFSLNF